MLTRLTRLTGLVSLGIVGLYYKSVTISPNRKIKEFSCPEDFIQWWKLDYNPIQINYNPSILSTFYQLIMYNIYYDYIYEVNQYHHTIQDRKELTVYSTPYYISGPEFYTYHNLNKQLRNNYLRKKFRCEIDLTKQQKGSIIYNIMKRENYNSEIQIKYREGFGSRIKRFKHKIVNSE